MTAHIEDTSTLLSLQQRWVIEEGYKAGERLSRQWCESRYKSLWRVAIRILERLAGPVKRQTDTFISDLACPSPPCARTQRDDRAGPLCSILWNSFQVITRMPRA